MNLVRAAGEPIPPGVITSVEPLASDHRVTTKKKAAKRAKKKTAKSTATKKKARKGRQPSARLPRSAPKSSRSAVGRAPGHQRLVPHSSHPRCRLQMASISSVSTHHSRRPLTLRGGPAL